MFSPLEQFDVIIYIKYFPIPFVNLLTTLFLYLSVILIIIYYLNLNLKLIPTIVQSICELIFKFIFNIIKQQLGKDGYLIFH